MGDGDPRRGRCPVSPLYVYRCEACEEETERLVVKTDPESANPGRCPKCGTWSAMTLVLGPSKLKFNGAGFHATDYPKQQTLPDKTQIAVGAPGRKEGKR